MKNNSEGIGVKFKNFLNKLRELDLPDEEYAIFGSGPLAVRGLREARDLDVIVTCKLYEKLRDKYPEKDKGIMIGDIEIISPHSSVVDNPEEIIKRAETIGGFKFALLNDIMEWKKKRGREKDFKDIKLIQGYLENKD